MAGGRGKYEWLWFDPSREQYRALIYIDKVRKRPKLMTRKEELSLIENGAEDWEIENCLLYTSPSPRDVEESRMPSSA